MPSPFELITAFPPCPRSAAEERQMDAANMEAGISEALGQTQDMITRACRYGMPDTAHELRVAVVALQRAIEKAQAAL